MPLPKYYKEKIFTDELKRKEVTDYLQKRIDDAKINRLKVLKKRYPNQSDEYYINLYNRLKQMRKFDKRFNEVL